MTFIPRIENPTIPNKRPEVKADTIELPKYEQLILSDAQDLKTLEELSNGEYYDVYMEPNPEKDYIVYLKDGTMTKVCEVYQLNGIKFFLYPGKNTIPRAILELMNQNKSDKEKFRVDPTPKVLGEMTRG